MNIKTEEDLLALVTNKVEESTYLEYKRCAALSTDDKTKTEISKDVSAIANSAGGTIIYGLQEEGHVPVKIDDGFNPDRVTKEWLESIINSRIRPKIDGITIIPIELKKSNPGNYIFVVEIPRSSRAPHQAFDYRYYKRYNFESAPMEDYEIKDVANRRYLHRPLISVDTFVRNSHVVCLSIKNIGTEVAINVKLVSDKDLKLRGERDLQDIPIFSQGIKFFPPGKEFVFWYGTFPEIIKGDKKPSEFLIKVSYHKINDPLTEFADEFPIDIKDYHYTTAKTTLIEEQAKNIHEAISKLTNELSSKLEKLTILQTIAGPTGLQLSTETLRNIKHIACQESFERINAQSASDDVFMEVLGIDIETAYMLCQWIQLDDMKSDPVQKYSLSPSLLERFNKYFFIPGE